MHSGSREEYSCNCKKTFATISGLKMHISSVHDKEIFSCDECEKSFTNKSNLRRHYLSKHNFDSKKFECDLCQTTFTENSTLKRHLESVHEKVTVSCDQCDKEFSLNSIRWHKRIVHEGIKYDCNKCEKVFKYKHSLDKHIRSYHEGKVTKCHKCEKSFHKSGSLKSHLDWHDMKENGLMITCKECHKNFVTRKTFNNHLHTVHKGLNIEPELILLQAKEKPYQLTLKPYEENELAQPQEKEKESKPMTFSKPKKGKWIVKLKRLII